MEKKYWKGLEELRGDAEFVKAQQNEFAEYLPIEALGGKSAGADTSSMNTNRRDFLKFLGFGVAAATLASCEAPVKKTIPYLVKPEEITPGIANWYASTYFDGYDYGSVLVKTREGRPIKLEGNNSSSVTKGGLNARIHASVLSLYDSARLRTPLYNKQAATWEAIDRDIKDRLAEVAGKGGKVRILSSTVISPSMKAAIAEFSAKHNAKHVTYDAVSSSAIVEANNKSFGKAVVPSYKFNNAKVIVGFGADFLENTESSKQYIETRKLEDKKEMSRHIQFETTLSLTGSNADKRYAVKPSEQDIALVHLYNKVAGASLSAPALDEKTTEGINNTAKELLANKGKSLVVSGSNLVSVQLIVNAINSALDNYGATIDLDTPSLLRQGNDAEVAALLDEMKKGEVAALFIYNTNPAYTLPNAEEFKSALGKVSLKIAIADREDETASLVDYVAPDNHYLESWSDAEPTKGFYSLGQPTIAPLFTTRHALESFLVWSGNATNAHDYIAAHWKANMFGKQNAVSSFEAYWNNMVKEGVFETAAATAQAYKANADVAAAAAEIAKGKNDGIELALYVKTGLGTGSQANNPWLQELPDPISKVCWDNYAAISPRFAKELGVEQGDVIMLTVNGVKTEAPVFLQPGQAFKTIGVAVGYGRTKAGKAADNIGFSAYPFVKLVNNQFVYNSSDVKVEKTGKDKYQLAATQTHHTMMGRAIVKETSLGDWLKDPKSGNPALLLATHEGKVPVGEMNIWQSFDKPNHRWGLAIDLNGCTGCGACVVSCQAENNVPVVGKDEIARSREMHWIRIDRYYSSDEDNKAEGEKKDLHKQEIPSDEPQVVFQPVMCQHCNHAPCETVCPVAATTHSSEGLNQMAYNRCVGTRYCANNCPYKVRRFNWFKYSDNAQFDFNMNDDLGKMVLNPDVVVRSRGVMEKCTMCVQRIQEVKLTAKKESRRPKDGEIQTACTQSCPANAIVFGDFNDPESRISKMFKDERSYHLLEELDVQPSVFYQTKVRNA